MRRFIKSFKFILISLLVLLMTACAFTREVLDLDTELNIEFSVSSKINPDSDGRSSPIVLNLLYLRDNRQFELEELISLLEAPEDRLGKDLIEMIRLKEFIPSETREFTAVLPEGVNYVGIVAEFIQYQDAQGTLILPIEQHASNDFMIVLENDKVGIDD
jgi:type VI secretion system protein VasD